MYLHIIYKNGEKGGVELSNDTSSIISNNFDSDVYVDTPINITAHFEESHIKFDGLTDDITIQGDTKPNSQLYSLPCNLITDDINLIFTAKEQALDDLTFKTIEQVNQEKANLEEKTNLTAKNTQTVQHNKLNKNSKNPTTQINKKNIIYLLIIILCITCTLILMLFYKSRHLSTQHNKTAANKTKKIKLPNITDIIANIEKDYPFLTITHKTTKNYQIAGFTKDKSPIEKIHNMLGDDFNKLVDLQIFDLPTVKIKTTAIFKKYNINKYSVNLTNNSSIIIKYFSSDNTDVDMIQSEILDNYPSEIEDNISIQVITESELTEVLDNLTKKYPTILTKIGDDNSITISGSYNQEQIKELQADINEITVSYSGILTIVKDIKSAQTILPINIAIVYDGYPSWVMLDNGTQIYQGDEYNGFILTKVTDKTATFKGKYKVEISL